MIVEIHGAGFENKGAELMLRATVAELQKRVIQFVPAIDPTYGAYELRSELALRQILPPRKHVGARGFAKRFQRQKLFTSMRGEMFYRYLTGARLDLYGCVTLAQVQCFVDIAGFAYTDEWGSQPTQDLALLTHYYRSAGKPVILLPQAFGPFIRRETRIALKKVLENATLVFARDQQSYDHVLEFSPLPGQLHKAPDITLFYPDVPLAANRDNTSMRYVCIVPNVRMLDQGKHAWEDKYKTYLFAIAKELQRCDVQVFFVVHDTSGKDMILAQEICTELALPAAALVQEQDPIALKQFIAGSLFLVGSRYHSLVAAFASTVPAIGMGWSHKYEMLFDDFDCRRFLIPSDCPIERILNYCRELAEPSANMALRGIIAGKLKEMRSINETMWHHVADLLTNSIH